jgi:hypothetical protein
MVIFFTELKSSRSQSLLSKYILPGREVSQRQRQQRELVGAEEVGGSKVAPGIKTAFS